MLHVDTASFFLIVLSSSVAAITVAILPKRIAPPNYDLFAQPWNPAGDWWPASAALFP